MTRAVAIADISVANAQLPAAYESAKAALANCVSIDECQEWANKAEALASYARQADDDTLEAMCARIKGRAVRRCGELLKQFDARGDHRKSNDDGTSSQRDVAASAGMSKRQQVTAVRVAGEWAENEIRKAFTPSERVAIANAVEANIGSRQGQ